MTREAAPKLCARCGRRLPADSERRIYSRWTRSYYCADLAACGRRAGRLAKRRRAEDVSLPLQKDRAMPGDYESSNHDRRPMLGGTVTPLPVERRTLRPLPPTTGASASGHRHKAARRPLLTMSRFALVPGPVKVW